jgi:hypothetical protein
VAPAYSLAATLGFIVAVKGVGLSAPAVLLVSFLWVWARHRAFFARGLEAARPDALERPPVEKAIA